MTDERVLPAYDILAFAIARFRGEVADDIMSGISRNHFGRNRLSRAGEDLDCGRADPPMKLQGTYTKIYGIGGSGDMVGVQSMASRGLTYDILVRGINERYERTLALEFERA